jgi:hypothetical protein
MAGRHQGYHQGYEVSVAHQAEMCAVAVQDRLARSARAERRVRRYAHLVAQLHERCPRWGTGRPRAAARTGEQG